MRVGSTASEMTPKKAREAAAFFRILTNENRLTILCHLAHGEWSVTDLAAQVGIRQSSLSQQLARLREEGFVKFRRDRKLFRYSLIDPDMGRVIELFCHQLAERKITEIVPRTEGFPISAG